MRLLLLALLGFLVPTIALAGASPGTFTGDGDPTKMSLHGFLLLAVYAGVLPLLMLSVAFGLKRTFLATGIILLGLVATGCQTADKTNWGQVAQGTAIVIGSTPYNKSIEKQTAQLAQYCPALQVVGAVAGAYLEKQRAAIMQANAAVNEVCLNPPKDVAAAVIVAARAYEAAKAAKLTAAGS